MLSDKLPSSRRVLVVDDEPEILRLFAEILGQAGWQVDQAGSVDEAVLLYSLNAYDLITLDWSMPGLGGADFHRVLTTSFGYGLRASPLLPPRLPPILIITGHYDLEEVQRMAFAERVVGIVPKPLGYDKLVNYANDIWNWESQCRRRRITALARKPQASSASS